MKRILIVDDIEENLYLLRTLLEGHGYAVDQAGNGSEAIVQALSTLPDMVISDILMPVIDGYTLCRIWKADPRLKRLPFVFYTATYTDPHDERLALDMGADAFIVKPAEVEDFLARIETVLDLGGEGKLGAPQSPRIGEEEMLKHYSEALIRKLEHKMFKLEEANRELEATLQAKTQAESALRESEEKFRQLFNLESDAIFLIHNETGEILEANESAAALYGYAHDELVRMKNTDLSSEPDKTRRAMADHSTVIPIRYHRKKDGSVFPVEITASHLQWNGQPAHIAAIRDISARMRTEETMRENERIFRLITDNMTDTLWMMDLNFSYSYASPSLLKNRGYTFDELRQLPLERQLTPESYALAASVIAEEMTPERLARKDLQLSRTMELENVRKDGSTFWAEVTMTILRDPDGVPVSILGVGRNITDRKRAEDAIKRSLREKELLLREIHHRVKNNMQVISSLVSLQSNSSQQGDPRAMLTDVQNRIRSIALIHELLYMSDDVSRIDFGVFVGKIVQNLTTAYGASGVTFSITGDAVKLGIDRAVPCGLIMNELISNALKHAFAGKGRGAIAVDLRERGGECVMTVADDGDGLPENVDMRGAKTLGFRLVHLLAEQIGGTIAITRKGGTAFRISFRNEVDAADVSSP